MTPSRPLVCAIFLACLVTVPLFARQSQVTDSLRAALDQSEGQERGWTYSRLADSMSGTDPDQAIAWAWEAVAIGETEGDSLLVARSLRQIGVNLFYQGSYEAAQTALLRGYDAAGYANEKGTQALILNELGTLYKRQGDKERSMEYFETALELSRAGGDSLQVANSLNNMGIVYDDRGEWDKAMELFRISADMKESLGDINGLTYNLDNMGQVSARMEEYEAAEAYFLRAAELRRDLGNMNGYGIVLNNIGEMFALKGDWNAALPYFRDALDIARETEFADFERHVLGMLSQSFEARGDYATALDYYKQQKALSDSLYTEERSRQIVEMREQFETERKEQTIALQTAELAEQEAELQRNYLILGILVVVLALLAALIYWRRAREELRIRQAQTDASIESQERERKRIAQDLHDGLGQLISTARLQLVAPNWKPSSDSGIQPDAILNEMHTEIRNIAFNLMPSTLLHNGAAVAIRELARRISAVGGIRIGVSVVEVDTLLPEADEIALYRIVQEWLNNVMKYSQATEIDIQFVGHDDELTIMVEDNGNGFDPEGLGRSNGNGWKNIQTRSRQTGGRVHVDSRPDATGTTFVLRIPRTSSVIRTESNTSAA